MTKKLDTVDKIKMHLIDRLRAIDAHMQTGILEFKENVGDAGDIAFGVTESTMASKLADHGSKEAAQIQQALQRLSEGRYGICEECDNKIPPGRLEVLPYCTLCISCQKLEENCK